MPAIIGDSPWAREIRRSIGRAANVDSTVLIVGPSGTGKELIARSIHQQSRRSAGPWVAVDCTSIPAGLFASQLFGHVKGAFSGASCATLGSFAQPTAEPSFSTKSASWARTCRPNCCA